MVGLICQLGRVTYWLRESAPSQKLPWGDR